MTTTSIIAQAIEFTKLIIPFGLAAILHEIAHGYMAYLLGDNTAKESGRLTLNPFKHIDLFGTILFPILLSLANFIPIILFKPVPINPANFKNPIKDSMKVALAGPLTNFFLAFVTLLIYKIIIFFPEIYTSTTFLIIKNLFIFPFILINLILGSFNLIPFPPLDGHWVLNALLGVKARFYFQKYKSYLTIIFLILVISGGISPILGYTLKLFIKIANWFLRI